MNNKNILLFGSNGLVGSSVKKLFETDENVNLIAATRNDADLFDFESTKNIIKNNNPEIIINSAAKVGGIYANNKYRTDFLLNNLKININILEACIGFPDIKIINLGSSCIYPLDAKNPIKEDDFMNGKLEHTNSPYAMAKIAGIEMGRSMNSQFGHNVINLMPTNLYGPNDNFHPDNSHVLPGLMHKFHLAKIKNQPSVEVWGTGKAKREFMHVDDLGDACVFALENWRPNINEPNFLNVGTGSDLSIKELAQAVATAVGFTGNITWDITKPDGTPKKQLDVSRLKGLGWSARIPLQEGLARTVEDYKYRISHGTIRL